jgi:iron complex transport system permease protein
MTSPLVVGPDLPRATRPSWGQVTAGVAALLLAALGGLVIGPAGIEVGEILRALGDGLPFIDVSHGLTDTQLDILWQLRLPRVVLGAIVGATLAISGAAYQGVFRNPLADPYLLGVAAGAGFGATLAFVFAPGAAVGPIELLPIAAFGGALIGVGLTYGVGRTLGDRSNVALILAGVAVASFLTAVQTFIQQRNTDTLREVYSWILGSISTLGWSEVLLALPYAGIAAVAILLHRRLLDVLAVGEEESRSLGVSTGRVRATVVIAASLGTAAAVAVSGLIGFVGIIVPHTVRLLTGWSYRVIIPLSALFGGAFLVAADLVARSVMSPAELPIGVVTAFLGAPFFAIVMRSARRMR